MILFNVTVEVFIFGFSLYKLMQVIENKVLLDENARKLIYQIGYAIVGSVGKDSLKALLSLYHSLHTFEKKEGGMFYSLYSDNLAYRQEVHHSIFELLQPIYNNYFHRYKTVINSFIVKTSGLGSDFSLHQDSTGLDEFKFSPLSVWIPLQDTNMNNGTLCVVPKTHGFFHPFRGISFSSPFATYEDVVRRYLQPINLKAGEILLFDNRLVHYSHLNNTDAPRIVVMSGVFPEEATILSVYKDESKPNSPIEVYEQSEDFLITNKAFYKDCTARPYRGKVIKTISEPLPDVSMYDFMSWATKEGVLQTHIEALSHPLNNMKIISEPNENKLKILFHFFKH